MLSSIKSFAMKSVYTTVLVICLLGLSAYLSLKGIYPQVNEFNSNDSQKFSVNRAAHLVGEMSQEPHFVGSSAHSTVRNYIVQAFENLDLEVSLQSGTVITDYGIMASPTNIVCTIKGKQPKAGSDLLILSHYDSAPFASLGASDDAAGVATILETLRALKAQQFQFKNNVIICITDAEEIGLLGAKLFVEKYPEIENIGLVLNFEARGTSGPAFATLETNGNNAALVNAFAAANTPYPVANSLYYEIYKKMPNATDATIFRVEKNIPTFFMAFIDNYFYYHTAMDNKEQLNLRSLAHQGSYLMALLPYFGNQDLSQLNSQENRVFFNVPFFGLLHYKDSFALPLLLLAILGFGLLIFRGIKAKKITCSSIGISFVLFLLNIVLAGVLGYLGWKIILWCYPPYKEIIHGFPYNGYYYIAAFIFLVWGIFRWIFWKWIQEKHLFSSILVILFFMLVLNVWIVLAFKGASFFILPVLCLIIAGGFCLRQNPIHPLLALVLGLLAIFIFLPLIAFIPVALKMEAIVASLVLLIFLLYLILPIQQFIPLKKPFPFKVFVIGLALIIIAHFKGQFSSEQPRPNSLLLLVDQDEKKAYWKTYDETLDEWTSLYFKASEKQNQTQKMEMANIGLSATTEVKPFAQTQATTYLDIPATTIIKTIDTLSNGNLKYSLQIIPQRKLNLIALNSPQSIDFSNISGNQIPIKSLAARHPKSNKSPTKESNRLLSYFPNGADTLNLSFEVQQDLHPVIEVFGISNDLLSNPWVKVPARPKNTMPKAFVVNDVIVTKQKIEL